MCVVMAIISGGLVFLFLRIDFIPQPASVERGLIDHFLQILFAIAAVFFGVIITILGYSLIFFRRQKGDVKDAKPIRGNTFLELTWTIIPLVIVMSLAVYGAMVLNKMTAGDSPVTTTQAVYSLGVFVPDQVAASPQTADTTSTELVVNVTASRFAWEFEYPDYNIHTYELEVPVNRRIVFNIKSKDVVHSFWVQEWGPKQDAVPGLSPTLRITPTQIGQYQIQCSQLCGYDHTDMTAPVKVVSASDFDTWVKQQQATMSATTTPSTAQVMVDLVAQNISFDKNTITVPAGAAVMINFDNKDISVAHNFAVYTDSTATKVIYQGQIVTGPATTTYIFTAPSTPGSYFFRCDVHPTMMTGTLVVQ